jgi:hypothetical protein
MQSENSDRKPSGYGHLPTEQEGMKLSFTNIIGSPYEAVVSLVSPRSDDAVLD